MAAKNDTMYDISVFSFLDGRTLADASSRGLGGRSSLRDDFYTNDVFMHTWDLARGAGLDDRLDADSCADMVAEMVPLADVLAASGQYGPPRPGPRRRGRPDAAARADRARPVLDSAGALASQPAPQDLGETVRVRRAGSGGRRPRRGPAAHRGRAPRAGAPGRPGSRCPRCPRRPARAGRASGTAARSRRCSAGRPGRSAGRTPPGPRSPSQGPTSRSRSSARSGRWAAPATYARTSASCRAAGSAANTDACSATSRKNSEPHGASATTSTSASDGTPPRAGGGLAAPPRRRSRGRPRPERPAPSGRAGPPAPRPCAPRETSSSAIEDAP